MGCTSLRSSSKISATSETILRLVFLLNLTISSSSLASWCWSVGVFLLDSYWSFVAAIFVWCFDSWKLWWGEPNALQLSPFADAYAASPLERAPFDWFQILIFQLKRIRLLSFLSWSYSQFDFWTSFLENFHHASGVNLSSPSRLFWLDLRNPSNYSADYIIYGRSLYLNFDPPSRLFVW